MPASRLSDRQKAELVERFRGGEGSQALAQAYACSANTVSRVLKAALDPQDYERLLKEQRSRRSGASEARSEKRTAADAMAPQAPAEIPAPSSDLIEDPVSASAQPRESLDPETDGEASEEESDESPSVLALDDADDFGDDDDDSLDDGEDDGEDPQIFVTVAPLVVGSVDAHREIRPLPLETADLPASAYMLVDKTVELQPKPLSECSELGPLPAGEQDRQALLMFLNPRQAKRQCGRTQRVIKIPDTSILRRTAPFLVAQGISRVVIEGALFSLSDS